jgi:hypothetical protein
MPATREVPFGERLVTVREMTVGEVRDWMVEIEQGTQQIDPAGEYVFDDCSLQDLMRMSDATKDVFDSAAPSDIEPLRQAARELNPHFFRVRAAVAAAQQAIVRRILSPDPSNAAPLHS